MPNGATRDIYVMANGLRHHLLARGKQGAPIVMMLHGLTQQAHVFDAVASRLAKRFHVYCLDVRGRGESDWGPPDEYRLDVYVRDLEALREALGIERFALVGTSMGGLISMYYAPRHPDHVRAVVLNDVGPDIAPAGLQRIMTMLTSAPHAFTDLKAVARYYREANAPVLARRSDEEVLEYARWHVRRDDTGLYVWKMDPAIRRPPVAPVPPPMDPWQAFRSIAAPVLVIRGAESDILDPTTAAKMVAEHRRCSLIEVPGVGHAPALSEPEAYGALERFLLGAAGMD